VETLRWNFDHRNAYAKLSGTDWRVGAITRNASSQMFLSSTLTKEIITPANFQNLGVS